MEVTLDKFVGVTAATRTKPNDNDEGSGSGTESQDNAVLKAMIESLKETQTHAWTRESEKMKYENALLKLEIERLKEKVKTLKKKNPELLMSPSNVERNRPLLTKQQLIAKMKK
uniref:Uncharacterized protein n=1 Tax=Daphnia galeata TaxID=27404 RepID=A0A8J2WR32_9CRUS|nr:unnamed protein product [Daphnia galeata]